MNNALNKKHLEENKRENTDDNNLVSLTSSLNLQAALCANQPVLWEYQYSLYCIDLSALQGFSASLLLPSFLTLPKVASPDQSLLNYVPSLKFYSTLYEKMLCSPSRVAGCLLAENTFRAE